MNPHQLPHRLKGSLFALGILAVAPAIACQTPHPKFKPHEELGLENTKTISKAQHSRGNIPLLSQKTSHQKSF
jgi:hypothetical protein